MSKLRRFLILTAISLTHCDGIKPYYINYLDDLRVATSLDQFAKKTNLNVTLLLISDNKTYYSLRYDHQYQANENSANISAITKDAIDTFIINYEKKDDKPAVVHSQETYDSTGILVERFLYKPNFDIKYTFTESYLLNIKQHAKTDDMICTNPYFMFEKDPDDILPKTLNILEYRKDGAVKSNITTYRENRLMDYVISSTHNLNYVDILTTLNLFRNAMKKPITLQQQCDYLVRILELKYPDLYWSVHLKVSDTYSIDAHSSMEIYDNKEKTSFLVHSFKKSLF